MRKKENRQDAKTHGLVLSKLDVNLRKLSPSYELARSTVDGFPGKLDGPLELTFRPKEVALDVKERVRLRVLLESLVDDLDRLDFLV